jgi:prevent-host-death family protein
MRSKPTRPADIVTVTSTKAQNAFGDIVDRAARDEVVMITRHAKPRVVLLSYERYRDLLGTEATLLPALAAAFDAQVARLQTPDVWAKTVAGFRASPTAMGRAALAAARAGSVPARRG